MNVALIPGKHDPEELYQLFRIAMEPYVNAARGTPWNDDLERTQFLSQLAPECIRIILLEGHVVGFLDVRIEGEDRFLHTMIVAPAWQSKGIGTAALGQLMSESEHISLSVLKANLRARAFYEREGFREVASTQPHYHMAWASNRRIDTDRFAADHAGR